MPDRTNPVLLEIKDNIARIRFNRPAVLNAIDRTLAEEFREACRAISKSPSTRVVVLSGEGRAFMSGGDLAAFHSNLGLAPETARAVIDPLHEGLALMADFPMPVVACVHGAVAGAGVSLMLACDLAIGADNLRLTMAYGRIGASLDGASSWSLPRVVGLRKAMELALLSDVLDAQEALRLGLINRVVPAADLAAETEKLIVRLAEGPTFAYGQIKRLLRHASGRNIQDQMDDERETFCACAGTRDFAEALNAFFERRGARFQGA